MREFSNYGAPAPGHQHWHGPPSTQPHLQLLGAVLGENPLQLIGNAHPQSYPAMLRRFTLGSLSSCPSIFNPATVGSRMGVRPALPSPWMSSTFSRWASGSTRSKFTPTARSARKQRDRKQLFLAGGVFVASVAGIMVYGTCLHLCAC